MPNQDSTSALAVTLANGRLALTSCVYNASGPRSGTVEALQKVARSAAGAVLTKSATLVSQTGNPLPRTHHAVDNLASFNSEGLPNNGIDYYIDPVNVTEVFAVDSTSTSSNGPVAPAAKKPYIVSLSGKCLADNITMLQRIFKVTTTSTTANDSSATSASSGIDAIELNLACPNVIGKPIIGYDMEQMDDILREIGVVIQSFQNSNNSNGNGNNIPPIGIKLPPYLDVSHMQAAATILNAHYTATNGILPAYIVTMNTMGNALCIDGVVMETPFIASNDGFAGLSGPACKYTALANVRKLRQLLHASIDIVGVGGISSGQDAYDMLLVGATAVQVATQHWKEGPACFDRICRELHDIVQNKGHISVTTVTNTLQPYSKDRAALLRKSGALKGSSSSTTAAHKNLDHAQDGNVYKILSLILSVILAIVLADKFRT